jgi:hypothetical protein
MRTLVAVLLLAATAGCNLFSGFPLPGPKGQASRQIERKLVSDKVPPQELVAYDGTRCVVTEDRFRRTAVGQRIWCVWLHGAFPGAPDDTGRRSGIDREPDRRPWETYPLPARTKATVPSGPRSNSPRKDPT